jgi:hypothetical protein
VRAAVLATGPARLTQVLAGSATADCCQLGDDRLPLIMNVVHDVCLARDGFGSAIQSADESLLRL